MTEDAVRALFASARDQADAALAANDPQRAARVWSDLIASLPAGHDLAREARYHHAQVRELVGEVDAAVAEHVELARAGHDGAWKALARMLEARWTAAREAPPGLAGRPARASLRELVDRIAAARAAQQEEREPARDWLETTEVEEELAYAQELHDRGDAGAAAAAFEAAGMRARAAKLGPLAARALSLAAAAYWHRLGDRTAALRALHALTPRAVAGNPATKAIADRAADQLVEELHTLIHRGDKRDAFVALSAAWPLLDRDHPGTARLERLYLTELASHHLTALDRRLERLAAQAGTASQELARNRDAADAVAGRLRVFALEEEREMVRGLRRAAAERELALLGRADAAAWIALQERSRDPMSLELLTDRMQRLALERMHYAVKVKSRAKDALASMLPERFAKRLVDGTYVAIRRLQIEVDSLRSRFLDRAYGDGSK